MTTTSKAAWVPFTPDRTLQEAAEIAMEWAEEQAANAGRPAVLVNDNIGEVSHHLPFSRYHPARHLSPRSSRSLDFQPGAVIAHAPTPKALYFATGLARGAALAVVEHPAPWRLTGWAQAVEAVDLLTGQPAHLEPAMVKHLETLKFHGNNGYARGWGQDNAFRALQEMHAEGLLDHDLVVSALGGLGASPDALETVSGLIRRIVPATRPR